ncbi:MAG: aldo/keto reductase [Frondihabitans sp.]|nr:aldo/keto reductase [Frondihabitans sp.]
MARGSGPLRIGEKTTEDRPDMLGEIHGERAECRVSGVQGGGQPLFRGDELRVPLEPESERHIGLMSRSQRGRFGRAGVDLPTKDRRDEVGPKGEMPIQGGRPHPRTRRNRADVHFDPVERELLLGSDKERIEISLRVDSGHDTLLAKRDIVPYRESTGTLSHFIDLTAPEAAPKGVTPMQYRTLGRTGIKVSPYALGAMMFGRLGNPDHDDSIRMIHKALDAGINFIDTADMYSHGESEEIVAKALEGRRDTVVLATKLGLPMSDDPNQQGASRRYIISAVEASLRRLNTDYIDLYQLHRPDPSTDLEESLSALTDLVRSGKVRAIGTSSMPASDLVEAQWISERRGLERFRTEQPNYSILNRGIENEVLPVAERYGMGTLIWSPLAQGLLTGRVRKGAPTDLRRATRFTHLSDERRVDAVEQIIPIAEQAGLKLTHLAMAFVITHPGVTSAIAGPRTMEQLDDLLAGSEVVLTDEILDQIDGVVTPGTDVGTLDMAYRAPAILRAPLRRRALDDRAAV